MYGQRAKYGPTRFFNARVLEKFFNHIQKDSEGPGWLKIESQRAQQIVNTDLRENLNAIH